MQLFNADPVTSPARRASVPFQSPGPPSFELEPIARAASAFIPDPSEQSSGLRRPENAPLSDQGGYQPTYLELSHIIQNLHKDLRAESDEHRADMMKVRAALGQQFSEQQTQIGEQQKTLDTANDATNEAVHIIEFIQSQLAAAQARVTELGENIDAKDKDIRQLRKSLHTYGQIR